MMRTSVSAAIITRFNKTSDDRSFNCYKKRFINKYKLKHARETTELLLTIEKKVCKEIHTMAIIWIYGVI